MSYVTFHHHFILRAKGAKRPSHSQNNKPKSIEKNIFHTRMTHDHSVRHGEKLKYCSAPMDTSNMYSVYKLLTEIAGYLPISILSFWLCYGSRPNRGHLRTQKRDQYSLNKFDQYKIFIIRPREIFFLEELKREILQKGETGPSFPLGLYLIRTQVSNHLNARGTKPYDKA